MAQNLARSSSGTPGSLASSRTRRLNVEPAQLTVEEALVHRWISRRRCAVTEIPLERDALALGVTHDAFAVAAELRVVAGEQHEAGQGTGAELVELSAIAPVGVDLPVRRDRAEVHDAGVADGWLVDGWR